MTTPTTEAEAIQALSQDETFITGFCNAIEMAHEICQRLDAEKEDAGEEREERAAA